MIKYDIIILLLITILELRKPQKHMFHGRFAHGPIHDLTALPMLSHFSKEISKSNAGRDVVRLQTAGGFDFCGIMMDEFLHEIVQHDSIVRFEKDGVAAAVLLFELCGGA